VDSESPEAAVDGPRKARFQQAGGGKIVPLGRSSDILFLEWEAQVETAKTELTSILYVMRSNIVNIESRNVIFQALQSAGRDNGPRKWPGDTFDMTTEEGRAILGTPNGIGVAYLLSQHQKQLGRKTITSVQVFDDTIQPMQRNFWRRASKPCLLFTSARPSRRQRRQLRLPKTVAKAKHRRLKPSCEDSMATAPSKTDAKASLCDLGMIMQLRKQCQEETGLTG
jgi:hypothetical protein